MIQKPSRSPVNEPSSEEDPEHHRKADDTGQDQAPRWARFRTLMASEFPSPFRGKEDPLAHQIERFVEKLDRLRSGPGGPAFLGDSGALAYTYPEVKNAEIQQEMGDLDGVLDEVVKLFNGAPNWGNPLTMCNVSPQGNTAAIIASMLSQVFAPDVLEGEYAWNVHRAELIRHNQLTEAVGNQLFEWFRAGKQIDGQHTPYLSFTTGFRNASYNRDGSDPEAVVYALKSFPMNVFITPEIMRWVLVCVHAARDEVLASWREGRGDAVRSTPGRTDLAKRSS